MSMTDTEKPTDERRGATISNEQRADLRRRIADVQAFEQARNYKEAITTRMQIRSEANGLLPAFLDALDEADRRDAQSKAEALRLRRIIAQLRKGEEATGKRDAAVSSLSEDRGESDGVGLAHHR